MRNFTKYFILLTALIALSACQTAATQTDLAFPDPTSTRIPNTPPPAPFSTLAPTGEPSQLSTPTAIPALRFAVIGDYGIDNSAENRVAQLVASWKPDLIITTGDNNYPDGSALTIDQTIGKYYQAFIHPYRGAYGAGASENNFFPSLGNHDWIPQDAQPYLDYFNLPGNERYYQFERKQVAFFAIDSNGQEPDGVNQRSAQADWLKQQMALSTATWKIVYFHHPPYSSGLHGSSTYMRWPFMDWGADLVLSGHDHTYERLQVNGLTYIVNGIGGGGIYDFMVPLPESQVRYNQEHGAMLIEADSTSLQIQFFNGSGEVIDSLTLSPKP